MKSLLAKLNNFLNYPLIWEQAHSPEHPGSGLGYLPFISILLAIGFALVSSSNIHARSGNPDAMQWYWLGTTLMIAPVAIRFLSSKVSLEESAGMLILFSVTSFGASYLRFPPAFRGFDEALHWRTAFDILNTGRLFTPNSMLPVSPLYPGLENITTALVSLSGTTIFDAAILVLLFSRILMMLSLYLLYRELSHSNSVAGIAALIYTGSSTFMYFEAQYSYESLALPLMLLSLYMLIHRIQLQGKTLWVWNILVALVLFSIVATHHMTSYTFIGILILWICADIIVLYTRGKSSAPIWAVTLLVALIWLWVGVISSNTISYLTPILDGAVNSFYSLIFEAGPTRQLFQDSSGDSALLFERVIAILAVLLLGLGLPFGIWQWWLRYRRQSLVITFLALAIAYPLLPIMRLSGGAWDMAHRASGFVFIGLGFIIAIGILQFPLPFKTPFWRQVIAIAGLTIVFLGGIVAGASAGSRIDLPYRPAAGQRSVNNQSVLAAEWARRTLGLNNRMASDRTMTQIMGSYGVQRMITDLSDKVSISGIFLSFSLTDSDMRAIHKSNVRYLVVDNRLTTVLPIYGYYFEEWEQNLVPFMPPVSMMVLHKFDYLAPVSRIYDSGSIVIYDIGALLDNNP